jgi:DNA-binding LacI/PurR family transcriptional regulator
MLKLRAAKAPVAPSNDPYYLEIAGRLREELLSGRFKPGQRFYSIRGLIRDTRRSLPTVRSALNLLIKENLLEARQGSGYYVTAQIESAGNKNKGFFNFLAVIPSSTVPDEPWFTGKIGLGMIHAANQDHAVVSFYRRQAPGNLSRDLVEVDLARIKALKPDGIAWLHSIPEDEPILNELMRHRLPIVTTMRRLPNVDLPLIREDDLVYASMVLSNFEARGHQRIGLILRSLTDDYFRSKAEALKEVANSFQVSVHERDFFFLPPSDPLGETQADALNEFLLARPELTGLLIVASTGIRPLLKLYETAAKERVSRLSVVFNLLDGVAVPSLPDGASLATIHPPLEKMGEQIVHELSGRAGHKILPSAPRLIPVFQKGDSLKAP